MRGGALVGVQLLCERVAVEAAALDLAAGAVREGVDGEDEPRVWYAYNDRLMDVGVAVEDLFDLARVDGVAAADDDVLLAVDEEEVALVVDVPDVAGFEPALVRYGLAGRVFVSEIAAHDPRAADEDLADRSAVDASIGAVDRLADRAELDGTAETVSGHDAACLGQPVALEYGAAEALGEQALRLGRERAGADVGNPHLRH